MAVSAVGHASHAAIHTQTVKPQASTPPQPTKPSVQIPSTTGKVGGIVNTTA